MRTQVGIVGSGPAGLLLAQILKLNGIDAIIVERKSRSYVEGRIRAGVLEQGTVDLLCEIGVSDRMMQQGLIHEGVDVCLHGKPHNINFRELTGKTVTIYGQTEITKDLIEARLAAGGEIYFDVDAVSVNDFDTNKPSIKCVIDGSQTQIVCDFIAGCDGFHGICRDSFPPGLIRTYEQSYPFAWLGILAESMPPSQQLIYVRSPQGFALFSMRSRTISRNYLQCRPDEDANQWSDDRVWAELAKRLGKDNSACIDAGTVLEKSVTQMRSFVAEPMQHGRLFLAGDAAHIVPPTGAKGLNLAAADVRVLAKAIVHSYHSGDSELLAQYSSTALSRVWKAQRFSWWMTSLLHNFPEQQDFQNNIHTAELEYVLSSTAALTALAENYVGLPYQ